MARCLTCILGKEVEEGFDRLALLPRLLTAYQAILAKLAKLGIEWVQIDEPILSLELETTVGRFIQIGLSSDSR